MVEDAYGRFASFTYSGVGSAALVSQIVDGAGRGFGFTYDTSGNLSSIAWPDGAVRRFEYGNGSFPWALTAVFDEKNVRYAMFGYDTEGAPRSPSAPAASACIPSDTPRLRSSTSASSSTRRRTRCAARCSGARRPA